MLSPSIGNNNFHLYVELHLYIFNCILFCIFTCFIGVGLNLTNLHSFWLCTCSFVYINLKLLNIYLNINVFSFVFFHPILTVAQNTGMAHLLIIPDCYSVYLVVFPICVSPEGCFEHPRVLILKSVHPIEVSLNLLFCS